MLETFLNKDRNYFQISKITTKKIVKAPKMQPKRLPMRWEPFWMTTEIVSK